MAAPEAYAQPSSPDPKKECNAALTGADLQARNRFNNEILPQLHDLQHRLGLAPERKEWDARVEGLFQRINSARATPGSVRFYFESEAEETLRDLRQLVDRYAANRSAYLTARQRENQSAAEPPPSQTQSQPPAYKDSFGENVWGDDEGAAARDSAFQASLDHSSAGWKEILIDYEGERNNKLGVDFPSRHSVDALDSEMEAHFRWGIPKFEEFEHAGEIIQMLKEDDYSELTLRKINIMAPRPGDPIRVKLLQLFNYFFFEDAIELLEALESIKSQDTQLFTQLVEDSTTIWAAFDHRARISKTDADEAEQEAADMSYRTAVEGWREHVLDAAK